MALTGKTEFLETDKVLTPAETKIASGYTCGLIGKEIADKCGINKPPNCGAPHAEHLREDRDSTLHQRIGRMVSLEEL